MKRVMLVLIAGVLLFASSAYAGNKAISPGAAPSSGDGVSEGSEWGGTGDMLCDVFSTLCDGTGPAPNAGDGVPDGSGF
jgi:hypothetical protein